MLRSRRGPPGRPSGRCRGRNPDRTSRLRGRGAGRQVTVLSLMTTTPPLRGPQYAVTSTSFWLHSPLHAKIRAYQVATFVQAVCLAPRAVADELLLPFRLTPAGRAVAGL